MSLVVISRTYNTHRETYLFFCCSKVELGSWRHGVLAWGQHCCVRGSSPLTPPPPSGSSLSLPLSSRVLGYSYTLWNKPCRTGRFSLPTSFPMIDTIHHVGKVVSHCAFIRAIFFFFMRPLRTCGSSPAPEIKSPSQYWLRRILKLLFRKRMPVCAILMPICTYPSVFT